MLKQRKSIVGPGHWDRAPMKAVELTQDKYDYIITAYGQVDIPGEQAARDAISRPVSSRRRVSTPSAWPVR